MKNLMMAAGIFLLSTQAFAGGKSDDERLQRLRDMVAKEELRSKELAARIKRLAEEHGYVYLTLNNGRKWTMQDWDASLSNLRSSPSNYLKKTDYNTYKFWATYNEQNAQKAYDALYTVWDAHRYIVSSHMNDR